MADQHQNDPETVDRLVNENIKLAHWMITRKASDFDPDEALSLALAGLQKAAETWNPDHLKQAKFGTYAALVIRNQFSRVREYRSRKKRGGGVTDISLDAAFNEDNPDTNLHSVLSDPYADTTRSVILASDSVMLEKALAILTDKQRDIITRRFGLNGGEIETLEQIAVTYSQTRERMRQIEKVALKRMEFIVSSTPVPETAAIHQTKTTAPPAKKGNRGETPKEYAARYYEEHKEEIKANNKAYRKKNLKKVRQRDNSYYSEQKETNPDFGIDRRKNQIKRRLRKRDKPVSDFSTVVVTKEKPKSVSQEEETLTILGSRPEKITVARNDRPVFSLRITALGRIIFTPYERGYTMEVPRNLDMEPMVPWKE